MTIYTSRHKSWHLTNTQEKIDALFTPAVRERFWSKVKRGAENECWPWTAGLSFHGYGHFGLGNRNWRANRVALLITKGPIPADMHALHTCDNRACCNPSHLFAGTVQQNNAQRDAQLKCTKGEKHHSARLTEPQVLEILASKERVGILAKRYGVYSSAIYDIWRGTTWKHLTRATRE